MLEDSIKIGNGMLPAISVLIPEVQYDKTLKNWTKLLETGTKSKLMTEHSEMSILGAIIKSITPNAINVYSVLSDRDSALYLAAAFELKKDVYIARSTGEADFSKAKDFVFEFAKGQYVDLASDQLKAEENKLKDLEKELGSLQRDQSGMEKSIRKNNRTIENERDRLVELNTQLTTLTQRIADERIQYTTMEEGLTKDEKEKALKVLEKDRKKLTKTIASSEKKISKAEGAIKKANNDIPRNDRIQEKYNEEIRAQETVVQRFTDKLNRIKGYK
jgi:septal ring factor EnvC (AmiA/AmiB activator)